jgi:type IV secretory pathway VirB2 component (pilin)
MSQLISSLDSKARLCSLSVFNRLCAFKKQTETKEFKKAILFYMFLFVCATFAFAQDSDFGLGTSLQLVVDFISNPWVRGVAFAALAIECIGMIMAGRQEQQMIKRFIPWVVGTVIFLAAGTITTRFLSTESLKGISSSLKLTQ